MVAVHFYKCVYLIFEFLGKREVKELLLSRDWEMLCILSEYKNITQAARQLFISQPALTKRIIHLEQELQIQLIERSVTGIVFTPQGEELVQYAREQIDEYELLRKRINSKTSPFYGTLRIGSVSAITQFVLPDMLCAFKKEYPNIEIQLYCGGSSEVAEKVHSQEYHVGFTRDKSNWKLDSFAFHQDKAYLVSRFHIDMKDLPKYPNISIRTDRSGRMLIQNWWYDNYQKSPNTIMVLTSANESIEMIKRGLGYGILIDQNFFKDEPGLICKQLYYKNGEPVSRNDFFVFRSSVPKNSVAGVFVAFAQEYFSVESDDSYQDEHYTEP